jgi:hypothetical protein
MIDTFCSLCGKNISADSDERLNSIRISAVGKSVDLCVKCALPFVELIEKRWVFI